MAQGFESSRNNEITEVKTEPVEIKSDGGSTKEVNENYDDFAKKEIGEDSQDVKTGTGEDDEDYDNYAKEETGKSGQELKLEVGEEDDEDYDNCAKVEAGESGQEVKAEFEDQNDEDYDSCAIVETGNGVQEFPGEIDENQKTAPETNMEYNHPDGSDKIKNAEGDESKNAEIKAAEVITENIEPENSEGNSESYEFADTEGSLEDEEIKNAEGSPDGDESKTAEDAELKVAEINIENVEPENLESNSEGYESVDAEGNSGGEEYKTGESDTEDTEPKSAELNTESVEPENPNDSSEGDESTDTEGASGGEEPKNSESNTEDAEPNAVEVNTENVEPENTEGGFKGDETADAEGNSDGEAYKTAEGDAEDAVSKAAEVNTENVKPENPKDKSEGEEPENTEGNSGCEKTKNAEGNSEGEKPKNAEGNAEGEEPKGVEGNTECEEPKGVEGNTECEEPEDAKGDTKNVESENPEGTQPNDSQDTPNGNCPRCGKNPCVCNSYEQLVGKQINKLEELTPQEIVDISQKEGGREYIANLHAEMAERVSAENMGLSVEEYRDYKRMSPEYQKQLREVPPPEPTQVERDAEAALKEGRAIHQKFHEIGMEKGDKGALNRFNNRLDAEIPKLQEQLGSVNQALEKANQEVDLMRSNDLDLKNPEVYAQALARQDNLDTLARHLRTEIATLDADMYDCTKATDRPYRGSIRPMDAQEREKTLDEARNVLHDGVENRQDVANALRLAEKIQFEAKPELDQKRREAESVIRLLENDQQKYLRDHGLTPEEALRDANSNYARNDVYLKNLYAERNQIHGQIVEMDRLENNLRTNLPVKDTDCRVQAKDLGNGLVEVTFNWMSNVKEKTTESKIHSSESKYYFNGTDRKETYIVGRDDDMLYGHKYSVQYRGIGYEREDTFTKGAAQLKTKLVTGLLNGRAEAGYETDIETGKTKASLDLALSAVEVKGQVSTVVNGRESTLLAGEVGVGSVSGGIKVDEKHGVAIERPGAALVAPKGQIAMIEMDGSNPLKMPETVDEAFTKMHGIREKSEELQKAAKKEWGEDVSGKTIIESKAPLTDRIDAALHNDKAKSADLQKLQAECADKMKELQELYKQAEVDSKEKFDAVFNYQKGTAEFKQALDVYNASRERKESLLQEIKQSGEQHAILAKRSEELLVKESTTKAEQERKAKESQTEAKYSKETIDEANWFGAFGVGERGFVKGEHYEQFIRDWNGYSADRYKTEMVETPEVRNISASIVEGISLSDYDIQNPDKFWSMHKSDGTAESFEKIAANIPEVQARLDAGESLQDLIQDPRVGDCASIYFHPNNMPQVIKCGDYYEFQENGRHRILAARNLGYEIPVRVVGERTIEPQAQVENVNDGDVKAEQSFSDMIRDLVGSFFTPKESRTEFSEYISERPAENTLNLESDEMNNTSDDVKPPHDWDENKWGPDPFKQKDSQLTNVLDSKDNNFAVDSLEKAKNFEDLSAYMDSKYGIQLDHSIKQLEITTVKEAISGMESVAKEYPEVGDLLKKGITSNSGVMSCTGSELSFNPAYFSDKHTLYETCNRMSAIKHWVTNASPSSIGVHEAAHGVEWALIQANSKYTNDYERVVAWNNCDEARKIVLEACNNLQKTPFGQTRSRTELVRSISKYALESDSETMAEAFADVEANGEYASPLSKEIKRLTKLYMNKYKGGK